MAINSVYIVVCVYPIYRMRNYDNRNSILLHTLRMNSLSELRSLILSNLGGTETKKVRRVGYRLLASLGNGVFLFRLFRLLGDEHVRLMFDIRGSIMAEQVMELSAEIEDVGGGGSVHSTYVQDDQPLAPPPIYVAIPVEDRKMGKEDSDEKYVVDSADSDSFEGGDEEEFVPAEMPAGTAVRCVLPPPPNSGAIRCTKEVRRVGGTHTCLAPAMSQDHRQLDSSLICKVILPLIQSNPSVSFPVLYHFKLSYINVWMVKQKEIAQIYRDWQELYNKVSKLLQVDAAELFPENYL
ncbi:hypothetical protein Ahy_B04g069565 [Arachis hypogaea]|uniref:Uncharacterized protein n=1 Tax=Arachis hypogaea TaxID=3818 RepID=A0A444ZCY9_ARAHY|nr:hypothetical protein Ahy_B04g069565 [Arachis hypogaea]